MEKNDYSPVKTGVGVGDVELAEKTSEKVNKVDASNYMDEHMLPLPEMLKAFDTNLQTGLTSEEAAARLERDGLNRLTPAKQKHWLLKAVAHVAGGFALLLWAGSILCFIVYALDGSVENLTLGIVLAVVVTLTGLFSWYQEAKSDAVLQGFMKLAPTTCDVFRDGKFNSIAAEELVKGDIVRLQSGKKVPADVIMLENTGVKVDNSSLTGEAEPVKRTTEASDPSPWRSKNVAFFGTNCVEGTGKTLVARCGDHTAIGGIATLTTGEAAPDALMKMEIERFVHLVGMIAISIGIVFLICALLMGYKTQDSLIFMIGIIVANVPEGLLATVTVALTITALRMADANVLVKSNLIVETLGSVSVIASDKTGTLTQNRMTVRNVIFADGYTTVASHTKQRTAANILDDAKEHKEVVMKENYKPYYLELLKLAGLCNHATFDERESVILQRRTNGDASENALMKFCHSNGNVDKLREDHPEVACLPFNSTNKIMITIHKAVKNNEDGEYLVLLKGAPERVLERCTHWVDPADGSRKPFDDAARTRIVDSNTALATNGERVLAFSQIVLKGLPANFEFDCENLKELNFDLSKLDFVGMISLEDPPRVEVPQAIVCCHEAGIKVVMVTGDHPLTARSIAAQIGILTEADGGKNALIFDVNKSGKERRDETVQGVVVTGNDLAHLNDEDWKYILTRNGIVFARTLPAQKQEIVTHMQEMDHVVAVTGDGVNDSPALKKADVGIAMGSGSEIAKEASDLILMDDNFASIVKGIEEGRLIFANLKKSIAYTLTSNIPEIIPFLVQIVLQVPLGLTTIMILVIDLGTDILPAISFAYEASESDIMKHPPRDRHKDKLVTWQLISFSYLQIGVIQAFAAFTVFFYCLNKKGFTTDFLLKSHLGIDWSDEDKIDPNVCYKNELTTEGVDANGCADFAYRTETLRECQSAFLATIVMCQIGCGIACKTRVTSILDHGFSNVVFNYGLIQETVLIIMVVYIEGFNTGFGTAPFTGSAWGVAIPFTFAIVFYDEMRKWYCRTYPDTKLREWLFY